MVVMEEWERLLSELRAEINLRERELKLLHEIDIGLLDPAPVGPGLFTYIVHETRKLLQAGNTTILLRRGTSLEPMYSTLKSIIGQRIPVSDSITGRCLSTDDVVNIGDLRTSPYKHTYKPLRGYHGAPMLSQLSVPIRIRDNPIGVLNAESREVGRFKLVHERISSAIAAQVAIAFQQGQVFDTAILLADVDRLVFTGRDTTQILQAALEKVMKEVHRREHVRHTGAQIMFLHGQELEIVHSTNPQDVGLTVPVSNSVSGRAVRTRKTVVLGDVGDDDDYQRMLGDSIRSEIAVPIVFGEDDIVVGVLNVESEEKHAFEGFYQVLLESFAERLKTILAFTKLREELTEALELRTTSDLLAAVGDQTSDMVHRLNNTVGAMRMRIKKLQKMQAGGTPISEKVLHDSLEALLKNAERTLKMPGEVTQILSQPGVMIDVNKCVRQALEKIARPENVRVKLELDDNLLPLPLYSFDIVVQNLIQNAVDAMPEGGRLWICTSVVFPPKTTNRGAGYFQLVVQDTGTGMTPEVRERLFDLHFSTKKHSVERQPGLGLGLWWVRYFVRRAKGDITVRSVLKRGTEFTVKIPLDREGAASSSVTGARGAKEVGTWGLAETS
jgi:signal transduction histidine kinase